MKWATAFIEVLGIAIHNHITVDTAAASRLRVSAIVRALRRNLTVAENVSGGIFATLSGDGLTNLSPNPATLEITKLGALVGIFDHLRLDRTRAILPAQTPTSCS
jgi:hypothetical protein